MFNITPWSLFIMELTVIYLALCAFGIYICEKFNDKKNGKK